MATLSIPGWCPETPVMESTHVTKENPTASCETKRGDNLFVEKITSVDGQSAALYLVPPGAEIEGSPMNACWENYMNLANGYVNNVDYFRFVSFNTQQGYNEENIRRESPPEESVLTLYRQFYNDKITQFRQTLSSRDIEDALEYLAEFNKERWQRWFGETVSNPGTYIADEHVCYECGDPATISDQCAECYWYEDRNMKKRRRYKSRYR